jgi:hypothetical protein
MAGMTEDRADVTFDTTTRHVSIRTDMAPNAWEKAAVDNKLPYRI